MGSLPSQTLKSKGYPQMGQDTSKQGNLESVIDNMEGSKTTRLRIQLEKKNLEIAGSTRTTHDALQTDKKNKKCNSRGNDDTGDESITAEDERMTIKIATLEEEIKTRDTEIHDLKERLLTMRRQKDNQVEVVKETIEKIIKDKDAEIRRLKALWGVDNEKFDSAYLDANVATQTKARFGISAEKRSWASLQRNVKIFPKTEAENKTIVRALKRNIFLSSLAYSQVTELVQCMKKAEFKASSVIMREGDIGTNVYVIERGEVDVLKGKENKRLAILTSGCVFGELAILYNCKRTATVRARTDVVLWSLDRLSFQNIVQRRGKMIREEYIKLLKSVKQLRHLSDEKIMRILDCLVEESFKAGDFIIRQGESGDTFYILYEGRVIVTKYEDGARGSDEPTFLNYMDRGSFFGERALLREEKRAANVISHTDVICLTLDRLAFSSLIGPIQEVHLTEGSKNEPAEKVLLPTVEEVAKDNDDQVEDSKEISFESVSDREKTIIHITSLEKLKIVRLLGKGGFGSVSLAQIADIPDRPFALKKMKKSFIVKTGQEQHVIAEKNILLSLSSSFVARMHRTYKDRFNIYMLMDAYLGGDMYHQLKKVGPFDEDSARFAIACVVEALCYLHLRCIAYRDLKPENLMLDHRGYVKIIDFGFAKKVNPGYKTWTFCGTPEYFPPEILQNLGHDITADYWSLGILTFELLTTTTPFYAPEDMTVYEKIVDGIERIQFPAIISKNAELLVRTLCRLDPKTRLGSSSVGISDIRKHRWFRGFFWQGLRRQLVKSPFNIKITGWCDTSNFERCLDEDYGEVEKDQDTSAWDVHF